jgi:MFS family permease
VLALGSGAGALAGGVAALAWSRAAEGLGFLLVSVAAPALIRQVVPPQRLALSMGLWGTYMPTGTALALLLGPLVAGWAGWRWWWAVLAGLAALAALALARRTGLRDPPAMPGVARPAHVTPDAGPGLRDGWADALRGGLGTPGPWLVGAVFACYAAQWLTVIGFLPTVYAEAGIGGPQAGAMTAAVALANVAGNLAAGRLLHRGWAPQRLLLLGFGAMALGAFLAFGGPGHWPQAARFAAVLAFSAFGGLVPATLFTSAVRVAPNGAAVPAVIGLTIQCSAFGQFVGPPLAATWTAAHGGWSATWVATGAAALAGALLAAALGRRLRAGADA